jgi:hypothetical protein
MQLMLRIQRGMPSASCLQHFSGLLLQFPEVMPIGSQQLFATLHASEIEATLQISPGSEQALPPAHLPNSSVELTLAQ